MKKPWQTFANVRSQSFVADLVSQAKDVSPDDLVDMAGYRKEERMRGGIDPLSTLVAYAQEELIYDAGGKLVKTDRLTYESTPRAGRLNVFGKAYRPGVKLYLNRTLADIMVGAATHLYETQGWTTVIYDGLRTVDGAFNLYNFASDADIANGLLALPGQSAHNKGLAVDSMMYDRNGNEVEMHGHFDHLDMETNSRLYNGPAISKAAIENRRIREAAFLRSALTQGLLIAPLRTEFWDDRPPENREDLWRVLDSAARVMGMRLFDETERKKDRARFADTWERLTYAEFLERWERFFHGREKELPNMIGVKLPPLTEKLEFYHGNFHPIYDASLKASGKHLTELRVTP